MSSHKVKTVCEIGINANGDINLAKQLIDVASLSNCDFVKFQKRTIDLVYANEDLMKPRDSKWGNTTRQQKEGLEFSRSNYIEIDRYCKQKDIQWFASPWDYNSVRFLKLFDIPYIKISSACMTHMRVLEEVKATNTPVIVSTGMCFKTDVDRVINFLGNQIEYVLACTSTYPTPSDEMNLSFIKTLKEEYPKYRIGFSNHHPGINFMFCAVALGAEMIEFHITLDRSMPGSDQASSIEPIGVQKIVKTIRSIEDGLGDGGWHIYESEFPIMKKLRNWPDEAFKI